MLEVREIPDLAADAGIGTWAGDARLYELSEEVTVIPAVEGWVMSATKHIVISAIEFLSPGGSKIKQTYIFAADEKGWPMDMMHLKGSIDGKMDHDRAVRNFISQHMKLEEPNG